MQTVQVVATWHSPDINCEVAAPQGCDVLINPCRVDDRGLAFTSTTGKGQSFAIR